MVSRAIAFWIASFSIRLRKQLTLSCRRRKAPDARNRTAIVVTFMPPAVDPGAPPTIISMIVIRRLLSLIEA